MSLPPRHVGSSTHITAIHAADGNEGSPSLRVLTYNVNFGTFYQNRQLTWQATQVLTAVRRSGADVVLLQETNEGWQEAFDSLRDVYPTQHFHNDTLRYCAAGSAVLLAPSVTLQHVETSNPDVKNVFFAGMVVHALFHENQIDFVNVHLKPPLSMGDEPGGLMGNVGAWWSEAPAIHEQEVQHYVGKLRDNAIKIIAGDFNEGSYGGAYRYLLESGWCNALDASAVKTTWHWPLVGSMGVWGSYDHIFFSAAQLSLRSCVVGSEFRDASDHLPVTAHFQLLGSRSTRSTRSSRREKRQS